MKPIAYYYELANTIDRYTREYSNWTSHISFDKPNVPEGSIRNFKELYEKPNNLIDVSKALADESFKNMLGDKGHLIDDVYHAIKVFNNGS